MNSLCMICHGRGQLQFVNGVVLPAATTWSGDPTVTQLLGSVTCWQCGGSGRVQQVLRHKADG